MKKILFFFSAILFLFFFSVTLTAQEGCWDKISDGIYHPKDCATFVQDPKTKPIRNYLIGKSFETLFGGKYQLIFDNEEATVITPDGSYTGKWVVAPVGNKAYSIQVWDSTTNNVAGVTMYKYMYDDLRKEDPENLITFIPPGSGALGKKFKKLY